MADSIQLAKWQRQKTSSAIQYTTLIFRGETSKLRCFDICCVLLTAIIPGKTVIQLNENSQKN